MINYFILAIMLFNIMNFSDTNIFKTILSSEKFIDMNIIKVLPSCSLSTQQMKYVAHAGGRTIGLYILKQFRGN